jgi:hypothetical protein
MIDAITKRIAEINAKILDLISSLKEDMRIALSMPGKASGLLWACAICSLISRQADKRPYH